MTRGDVIKLARQAGIGGMLTDVVCTIDELERFAGLVAAAEREAITQPSPEWHDAPTGPGVWLCDEGDIVYTWTTHEIIITEKVPDDEGVMWYGPIPKL